MKNYTPKTNTQKMTSQRVRSKWTENPERTKKKESEKHVSRLTNFFANIVQIVNIRLVIKVDRVSEKQDYALKQTTVFISGEITRYSLSSKVSGIQLQMGTSNQNTSARKSRLIKKTIS